MAGCSEREVSWKGDGKCVIGYCTGGEEGDVNELLSADLRVVWSDGYDEVGEGCLEKSPQ